MKKAIIIFTRVPIPGQTKTRMMPALSPGACARLHTCFLKDIKRECLQTGHDIFIFYTPEDRQQILVRILGSMERYFIQEGEGLGERMNHAFEKVFGLGYDECVLLGTDVPEMTASDLSCAFDVLLERDIVLGPTEDGGYYLIGMKKPIPVVFENQTYGQGSVLSNTVQTLKSNGYSVGFVSSHCDMDTAADLQGYRMRMRKSQRLKQSDTGGYLAGNSRISIIIPVYNEEKTILFLQKQLEKIKNQCEIIFVDGGSTDGTLDYIQPCYKVIHTSKGRAHQMNTGAEESTGDVLFFLHCDSELPSHTLAHIRKTMRDYRVGCFGIAFHTWSPLMFVCRVISNHRIKDRKVVFGDQGIFIERELFFEMGRFPELPIMEDYQFSLNLKERGEKIGVAGKRIYTSDRRFPKGTKQKLKFMWKMNRLRKLYREGVPAYKIDSMYEDVR